ncbi:MAG: hypothetical protein KJ958_03630 [Gammaproteobacteria bacterium]|nr:hypothetical protein [Gammaproteobacteria bacterium]MBU1978240.1 hypothetical protein [Gammaproteobacteria bacterium]
MTTKEHSNGKMADQNLPQDATSPAQSVDESRRRFGKSGLAAGGVIITLASRPVLGAWACQSPSGFQSGNVSSHGQPTLCEGRTPGYWQAKKDWPSPYATGTCTNKKNISSNNPVDWIGGTPFSGTFNCGGNGAIYQSACLPVKDAPCKPTNPLSLMQILLMGGKDDRYQLGAHITAAILNAKRGWTSPVLTEQAVKAMFNEWATKGYFEPSAGVKWSGEDIVTYLKTTMTL